MRFSVGLPVERPDRFAELGSGAALAELSRAAEELGYDAVSVTDHPFPPERWLRWRACHRTHDPLVALAYVAAATSTIRIHADILVLPYRNAFLATKGVASLDSPLGREAHPRGGRRLPRGRVIRLQQAASPPRNDALRRGDPGDAGPRGRVPHSRFELRARTSVPTATSCCPSRCSRRPADLDRRERRPRAIRRAVELGQGWMPFPQSSGSSRYTRTPDIDGVDDLRARIEVAKRLSTEAGRREPLTSASYRSG